MTTTEVLTTVFKSEPCDFCPNSGLVYIDPETGCRFCLDCLALSTLALSTEPLYDTKGN